LDFATASTDNSMAWALPAHPVLKKFGDVPDDPSTL
jgi:hypothetical protein